MSIANTFSGGVFLAIAFVHIIPETAALYYDYKYQEQDITSLVMSVQGQDKTSQEIRAEIDAYLIEAQSSFPLPFVLVLVGYSFILLIDKVLIDSSAHHHH